jgi:hypothetical protein
MTTASKTFTVTVQAAVTGFDYYIGPSGSDSNPGTQGSPWAITALQSKTATIANKRIGLLDGTYLMSSYATGGNSGGMMISAAGVTVEAVNARAAIITTNNGGSYPQTTSPVLRLRGNGISLKGIRFAQFSWTPINVNAKDILIEGCDFFDSQYTRISGYSSGDNNGFIFCGVDTVSGESYIGSGNVTVRNCRFQLTRNSTDVSNNNNTCIGPLYRVRNWTVEDCSFFDTGHAIFWKNETYGGLTVRRCYFAPSIATVAVYGIGNDTSPGAISVVENCVFDCPSYHVGEWDQDKTSSAVKVRNNTFLTQANANGLAVIDHETCPGSLPSGQYNQTDFYNNIVYRRSGSQPLILFYQGASVAQRYSVINYNLYPAGTIMGYSSAAGGATYTLAAWRTLCGQEAQSAQDTPTFSNINGTTAADFRLQIGSAGKDAGRVGGASGGATTDMGAWGYSVALGTPPSSIGSSF